MASTSTTTTSTTPNPTQKPDLLVSANFATTALHPSYTTNSTSTSKPTIDYDHEIYLQLTASPGRPAKTANQVYREERARQKSTRALDPAISDPQGEPGAIDFECAEKKQRLRVGEGV